MVEASGRRRARSKVLKDWLAVATPSVLVLAVGFAIAFGFVEPAPPNRIVIAAGATDGAYFDYARRYARILATSKVFLEVRATSGSVENLGLLRSGEVDVALVQGGLARPQVPDSPKLFALGSVFLEPLWVFRRPGASGELDQLAGRRIAVGAAGSGTSVLARELLAANGISGKKSELVPISGGAAARALLAGEVDAAFFVLAPEASVVQSLLREDAIVPMSFLRAEAYVRRYRFLSRVTLPRGAIDLASDRPKVNVELVAPAAALVTTEKFHPALVGLLLGAARSVHARGDLITPPNTFPSVQHLDDPINSEARRYLAEGPSFLLRYLPFWIANFLDRTKVLLLPLVALLLPMMRVLPPTYRWRIRSRIYRWYVVLIDIESRARDASTEMRSVLVNELNLLDDDVRKVHVPPSYADELYALRLHIAHVKRELYERR